MTCKHVGGGANVEISEYFLGPLKGQDRHAGIES
jgi:hypothetical protein